MDAVFSLNKEQDSINVLAKLRSSWILTRRHVEHVFIPIHKSSDMISRTRESDEVT